MWRLRKGNRLLPLKKRKKKQKRNSSTWTILETTNCFTDCDILVNVGKKIVCLQCRFKSWHEKRDIDCDYDIIIITKKVCSCKRHTVVHHVFCFCRFALLFLGLITHYHESLDYFFLLAYHHSHFSTTILDFTSFFTIARGSILLTAAVIWISWYLPVIFCGVICMWLILSVPES